MNYYKTLKDCKANNSRADSFYSDQHTQLANETINQLVIAGYSANYDDNGFAFDRAVQVLDLKDQVDRWSDLDFDRCHQLITELATTL